jgi:hypothetical protein
MSDVKLCECGCNQPAPIAKQTDRRRDWVKGQPMRFVNGHRGKQNLCRGGGHNWKHGMWNTPEYSSYLHAKDRCTKPNDQDWKHYGGRGIEFRFTSVEQFFAELGPRPSPAHSLDRIDNSGHYEPGNVRWATKVEQANNRRCPRIAA